MGSMPVKFLLDTHVWIWWHMRSENLSRKVMRTIRSVGADKEILLSAISVWEFCKLLEKGRLQISCSPEQWHERQENRKWALKRLVYWRSFASIRGSIIRGVEMSHERDLILKEEVHRIVGCGMVKRARLEWKRVVLQKNRE